MTDPQPLTDDELAEWKHSLLYRGHTPGYSRDDALRLVATVVQARRERDAAHAVIRHPHTHRTDMTADPRWTDPDIPELMDFLHTAWGIIANAADWRLDDNQNHEWVKAAERWRDQYHDLLPVSPDTPTPTGQTP